MTEKPILTTTQVKDIIFKALSVQIKEVTNGYSSPLKQIIVEVINENSQELKSQFNQSLAECFADKEFTKIVRQEFKHKVAKNLVAKLEGEVERAVNVLRQDPTMRAKMILAIEKMIQD